MKQARDFLKQLFSFDRRWVLIMVGVSIALAILLESIIFGGMGYLGAIYRGISVLALVFFPVPLVVVSGCLLSLSIRSIMRTKSIVPSLVLLLGVFLAYRVLFIIPIPQPIEYWRFLAGREEYEWIVENIDQLRSGGCTSNYKQAYETTLGCIYKDVHPELGLVVQFPSLVLNIMLFTLSETHQQYLTLVTPCWGADLAINLIVIGIYAK